MHIFKVFLNNTIPLFVCRERRCFYVFFLLGRMEELLSNFLCKWYISVEFDSIVLFKRREWGKQHKMYKTKTNRMKTEQKFTTSQDNNTLSSRTTSFTHNKIGSLRMWYSGFGKIVSINNFSIVFPVFVCVAWIKTESDRSLSDVIGFRIQFRIILFFFDSFDLIRIEEYNKQHQQQQHRNNGPNIILLLSTENGIMVFVSRYARSAHSDMPW